MSLYGLRPLIQSILGPGSTAFVPWGNITGSLSAQTDLAAALAGKVPITRTLTINGTSFDLAADRTWNVGTVTGNGSANYVAFWNGASGLSYDNTSGGQFFWDGTNHRLGIGNAAPGYKLHVVNSGAFTLLTTNTFAVQNTTSNGGSAVGFLNAAGALKAQVYYGNTNSELGIFNNDTTSGILVLSNGQVKIGTTSITTSSEVCIVRNDLGLDTILSAKNSSGTVLWQVQKRGEHIYSFAGVAGTTTVSGAQNAVSIAGSVFSATGITGRALNIAGSLNTNNNNDILIGVEISPTIVNAGHRTGLTGYGIKSVIDATAFSASGASGTFYGAYLDVSGASTNYSLYAKQGTVGLEVDLKLLTAGNGIYIKEGTNATMGTGTLVAGAATINTTKVTTNSRIFLCDAGGGVLANIGALYVNGITNNTSFNVASSNALDTSNFFWIIIEPA